MNFYISDTSALSRFRNEFFITNYYELSETSIMYEMTHGLSYEARLNVPISYVSDASDFGSMIYYLSGQEFMRVDQFAADEVNAYFSSGSDTIDGELYFTDHSLYSLLDINVSQVTVDGGSGYEHSVTARHHPS